MENIVFRNILANASLVIALGGSLPSYAAGDGPTAGSLGSNIPSQDRIGATDVYVLACPKGTKTARAKVNEGNNDAAQLSVQVINPHGGATTESGVNGGLSPEAVLGAGPGSYLVTVHKDAAGHEGYTITLDCYDADGNRFDGDQATQVQNQ